MSINFAPTVSNDTNAFYDAIAEFYPFFYRDWETQLDREGLGLRALFRNKGIQRILDASCGAGAQTIPLAQLGFHVVAADPSSGMLRKSQEIARQYDVSHNIEFVRSDFLNLPQEVQGPFDAVVTKGNALPHLLLDEEIETALLIFYEMLRPGGMLVVGMRDFGPFMETRPRFLPGFAHKFDDGSEFVSFDIWEWQDGPPVIATQNLYIVRSSSNEQEFETIKRQVIFRPLSIDEVKVVLMEVGFEEISEQIDRSEQVLIARKPLSG
jgi:glycine/sarcosine N-methyltransferase